jgi:hypothetical protein
MSANWISDCESIRIESYQAVVYGNFDFSIVAIGSGAVMRLTSGGVVMRHWWQLQTVFVNGAGPWRFRPWLRYATLALVPPAYLDV